MLLYLVQHAEAKPEDEDPERSLTERGRHDAARVASLVSPANIHIDRIYHSPKLRALQTAEILHEHLGSSKGIVETDGLAPMDDPEIWIQRLKRMDNNIMLVGHLPHMGRLASLLLCGDSDKKVVAFAMSGIVCLEYASQAGWSIRWMVTPEIARH